MGLNNAHYYVSNILEIYIYLFHFKLLYFGEYFNYALHFINVNEMGKVTCYGCESVNKNELFAPWQTSSINHNLMTVGSIQPSCN